MNVNCYVYVLDIISLEYVYIYNGHIIMLMLELGCIPVMPFIDGHTGLTVLC